MVVEVSIEDLKPQEVSRIAYDESSPAQSRFTGEGADLNLLHWLRHAEQAIEQLDNVSYLTHHWTATDSQDVLNPTISDLHAFFLKVLLPTPNPTLPKPGRPIRQLITRCMIKLHKKVESRSLFDFVQALTKAVGENNGGGKNMFQTENVARV